MKKIITYNFNEDFISGVADFIAEGCGSGKDQARDFGRTAVVFGGKRPALFLKKALAGKLKRNFIPPMFFSIDEFMLYLVNKQAPVGFLPALDEAHNIYLISRQNLPEILGRRRGFPEFLPWAREIISFIDQLDIENIPRERLVNIEKNAEIGYEVPPAINKMLAHIVVLREMLHAKMLSEKKYSRGRIYLSAAEACREGGAAARVGNDFDRILFCNFYDLHQTEKTVMKYFFDQDKAIIFFQKNEQSWPKFDALAKFFAEEIEPRKTEPASPRIKLYAGFDTQSQVGIVRELIKPMNNHDKERTVIVLPQPENIIALLSEISSWAGEFNVSMGYPLRRSMIYSLFDSLNRAQKTRKSGQYYARAYLGVLMHPALKNLNLCEDPAVTRVLVHKIEEILLGMHNCDLGGSLFVDIRTIENSDLLYKITLAQLEAMGFSLNAGAIRSVLEKLHEFAFGIWEEVGSFAEFSRAFEAMLDILISKSDLKSYPLNLKTAEKIYALCAQFSGSGLSKEKFSQAEIFRIFDEFLKSEKIAFSGMPLKGLQILGLFETRALSFDNVIIMDVNESILPRLGVNEPLIPRPVMVSLGLDRLEEEEGIQRYQFLRLINSAKNVHLVYNDIPEMQKSRFIEEIVWDEEKRSKAMPARTIPRAAFNVEIRLKQGKIRKEKYVLDFLKEFTFSPSSVNTYLNCPRQFYYRYVLKLSETEDLLDELESKEVGTFLHELLEDSFKKFLNHPVQITPEFSREFFSEFSARFKTSFSRRMKADAFMVERIMRFRLERFLDHEKERRVNSILGLEQDVLKELELNNRSVKFKCRIDRIDRVGTDSVLILDYKTGSTDLTPQGLRNLQAAAENPDRVLIKRAVRSFQLPLYLYCSQDNFPGESVSAALYNLRTLKMDPFPKIKERENKDEVMKYCLDMLGFIIAEIHDPEAVFEADESDSTCRFCPFSGMCG